MVLTLINSIVSKITLRVIAALLLLTVFFRLILDINFFQQVFASSAILATPLVIIFKFIFPLLVLLYVSLTYLFILITSSQKEFEQKLLTYQKIITLLVLLTGGSWLLSGLINVPGDLSSSIIRDILVLHTLLLLIMYSRTAKWIGYTEKIKPYFEWSELKMTLNSFDIIVFICILTFSVFSFMGVWKGILPFTELSSDAANIAGFVAARSYPEKFINDAMLGDSNNFNLYFTFYLPFLGFAEKLVGDFGTASILLYIPQTFLQGVGFYFLGREIYKNRFWAASLVALTFMYGEMNLGEFWGVDNHVVPRTTFQAALPFLLYLVIKWRNRPDRWPLIMFFAGMLVYLHPVSMPSWGIAIFLSLWFLHPESWSLKQRLRNATIYGITFLFAILPFAIHYLSNYSHGDVENYQHVIEIMRRRFSVGYLNPTLGVFEFFLLNATRKFMLFITGLVGILISIMANDGENKKIYKIIFLWLIGIFFVGIVIPIVDHGVANLLERLPYEIDLIRSLRYVYPILAIFSISSILSGANIVRKLNWNIKENVLSVIPVIGIILVFGILKFNRPIFATEAIHCFKNGNLLCPLPENQVYKQQLLEATKLNTDEGARISTLDGSLALSIRYYALRPIVFTGKDGGILGYSNSVELIKWYEMAVQYAEVNNISDAQERTYYFIELSRDFSAEYVIIDWDIEEDWLMELNAKAIYSNEIYTLVEIH